MVSFTGKISSGLSYCATKPIEIIGPITKKGDELLKFETFLASSRAVSSTLGFIVQTPEQVAVFLKWLPAVFQQYTANLDLSVLERLSPMAHQASILKDRLNFFELPTRITKLYEQVKDCKKHNNWDKKWQKLTAIVFQIAQKVFESTIYLVKWDIFALGTYVESFGRLTGLTLLVTASSLPLGAAYQTKEVFALLASIFGAWSYRREALAKEAYKNDKMGRLAELKNIQTDIINLQASIAQGNQVGAQALVLKIKQHMRTTHKLGTMEQGMHVLHVACTRLRNKLQRQRVVPMTVERQGHLNKKITEADDAYREAKDAYIKRFVLEDSKRFLKNNQKAISQGLPQDLNSEIQRLQGNIPNELNRLMTLIKYKINKTENYMIKNAEIEIRKNDHGFRFDIAKVIIIGLNLILAGLALTFMANLAATIGITVATYATINAVLGFSAWVTCLALGYLGAKRTLNLAFYSTPYAAPAQPFAVS
jgi:hypothetical protein